MVAWEDKTACLVSPPLVQESSLMAVCWCLPHHRPQDGWWHLQDELCMADTGICTSWWTTAIRNYMDVLAGPLTDWLSSLWLQGMYVSKPSSFSCSLPSSSLCIFPSPQFFIRVFQWWEEPLVRLSQPACTTTVYLSTAVNCLPNPELTVEARLTWSQVVEVRNYCLSQAKAIGQHNWAALNRYCREAVLTPWVKAQRHRAEDWD